jgi:hypothetical protein
MRHKAEVKMVELRSLTYNPEQRSLMDASKGGRVSGRAQFRKEARQGDSLTAGLFLVLLHIILVCYPPPHGDTVSVPSSNAIS